MPQEAEKTPRTDQLNFTKRSIEALHVPKKRRATYHDTQTPGLGLLIQPTGHQSFFWFRKVNGNPEWKTIGEFPALSVENARVKAGEFNSLLAKWKGAGYEGPSPFKKRNGVTFGELFDDYHNVYRKQNAKNQDRLPEEKALFERAVLAVSDRVGSARYGQAACFDAVAKLPAAKKNKEALDRAKAGFEAADTADRVLSEEIRQLRADVDKSPKAASLLDRGEEQLKSLRLTNTRLANHIKELGAVVTKESDPVAASTEVQAQALNARINLLMAEGEVDEALAAYDQLATLIPNNPEVKTRKEKLAAEWKPKDAEHAKARDYLLKTWPALATVQDIKDSLGQLRTATDVCKKAKDKYAFRRFLGILGGFPNKLLELTKDLDPNAAGALKILQDVKSIGEVAAPLEKDLADFLRTIE